MSRPVLVSRTRGIEINRGTRAGRSFDRTRREERQREREVAAFERAYDAWFDTYFTFQPPEIPEVRVVDGRISIDNFPPEREYFVAAGRNRPEVVPDDMHEGRKRKRPPPTAADTSSSSSSSGDDGGGDRFGGPRDHPNHPAEPFGGGGSSSESEEDGGVSGPPPRPGNVEQGTQADGDDATSSDSEASMVDGATQMFAGDMQTLYESVAQQAGTGLADLRDAQTATENVPEDEDASELEFAGTPSGAMDTPPAVDAVDLDAFIKAAREAGIGGEGAPPPWGRVRWKSTRVASRPWKRNCAERVRVERTRRAWRSARAWKRETWKGSWKSCARRCAPRWSA